VKRKRSNVSDSSNTSWKSALNENCRICWFDEHKPQRKARQFYPGLTTLKSLDA
jgi:hypothetical protein